ncbi:MAG: AarF/ABC1/UbiB kinase family protein, partial [Candidatus Nanopelagicales bacterium]|nr:AarF/ABC1/UbiB kinase family protein [Candidatus Nanopelagicales bacterium]
ELGPDWRSRFDDWNDQPAAAASIGQVHRAVARDGRIVAVKIQYPGAGRALLSDLRQLGRLARVFSTLAPGLEIKPLITELTNRVSEELDYLGESESQRSFAVAYEGDREFRVPHVLAASPRVIVSEWVDGRPLSDVIVRGTVEERNRAGLLYLRFLLSGPARAGLLHADPHPGNFRITDDNRLAVVDFGAVAHLSDGLPSAVGRLIRVALEQGDDDAVLAGLRKEGFVKPGIEVDAADLMAYLNPFIEPMRRDRFHFTRSWLRSQFMRIKDPRSGDFAMGLKLNLPPSYLLIHRTWMGSTGVLCQLDCEIPARAEALTWIPGFVPE